MRVLLLSDVHANLPALTAVLEAAGTVDSIWNLGDTVGYGARPNECISALQQAECEISLAGNHDLAAIGRLSTAGFNAIAARAVQWTSRELSLESRQWLGNLNSSASKEKVLLAHGSPREPVLEYVLDAGIALQNMELIGDRCCFVGHTHIAAVAQQDTRSGRVTFRRFAEGETIDFSAGSFIINPGSVGQPRDGDPRTAFAIIEPELSSVQAFRTEYDVAAAQLQILQAGLSPQLADRLSYGF